MTRTRTLTILLATVALTLVLTACGKDSDTTGQSSASASPNAFVLREWSITAPTTALKAGKVRITATNNGAEAHELVIVRSKDLASLPTKADGSVDEDKIAEADKPGEIAGLAAGKTASTTLDLAAGDYVAICNLTDQMGKGSGGMGSGGMDHGSGTGGASGMGHIHFRLGMAVRFTVT